MKYKIIQIILGAIGSIVTVALAGMANVDPASTAIVGLGAGPAATLILGDAANAVFGTTV